MFEFVCVRETSQTCQPALWRMSETSPPPAFTYFKAPPSSELAYMEHAASSYAGARRYPAPLKTLQRRQRPQRPAWNCRLDHVSRCDYAASPNRAENTTFEPWIDLACPDHVTFQACPKAIN